MRLTTRLIHKLKRLRRYLLLFDRPLDMVAYYRCRHWPHRVQAAELRPRGLTHPVLCRPKTSDAAVLWGTFGERFHRPPVTLPRDAVIVDLGANVGYTSVDLAIANPTARVIAVEMDAGNAAVARRNLERFGSRCTVVRAAVWGQNGEVVYEGDEEWAYRVVSSPAPDSGGGRAPSVTVPELLDEADVDRVAYMKMDVEGAEAELINEGAVWLDRVDSLKIEVHPPAGLMSCAAVLETFGFDVSTDTRHGGILVGIRRERFEGSRGAAENPE